MFILNLFVKYSYKTHLMVVLTAQDASACSFQHFLGCYSNDVKWAFP